MATDGIQRVDVAMQKRIDTATRAKGGTVTISETHVALLAESRDDQAMVMFWKPDSARAIAYALLEAADRVEGKEPARA